MRPILRLLLLLQLENYENARFLRTVGHDPAFLFRGTARQTIDWTAKMKSLALLSALFAIGFFCALSFGLDFRPWSFAVSLPFALVLSPVWIALANLALVPLDRALKRRKIARARERIVALKSGGMRVVAIAGSYGKTTQKHILAHILRGRFDVLETVGNYNTPLGIAATLDRLESDRVPDVFVAEMGEHYRGDIRELSELLSPDIAIVSGVTHQHLDRMGSIAAIIDTIFELPLSLPEGATFLFDTSDRHVAEGYGRYASRIACGTRDSARAIVTRFESLPDFRGTRFSYDGIEVVTTLLGSHLPGVFVRAIETARLLGMRDSEIQAAIPTIPFVSHRLEVIRNERAWLVILDDSYNGNPESVRATAELMRRTPTSGRKILLTPGLVELAGESNAIQQALGREISDAYDLVLLIDTESSRALHSGLASAGYPADRIVTYPTTETAHREFSSLLRPGDAIVFQNDWTDNYR